MYIPPNCSFGLREYLVIAGKRNMVDTGPDFWMLSAFQSDNSQFHYRFGTKAECEAIQKEYSPEHFLTDIRKPTVQDCENGMEYYLDQIDFYRNKSECIEEMTLRWFRQELTRIRSHHVALTTREPGQYPIN